MRIPAQPQRKRSHVRLIVKWTSKQDPAYEEPSSLSWENGSPATVADYREHQLDTHSFHEGDDGGLECHMYPDIIGEVIYDSFAKDWVVRGRDIITTALELHDPDSTDDQITTELFGLNVVYRAKITRTPAAAIEPLEGTLRQ